MEKDISIFSTIQRNSPFHLVIGTHSGIFHPDEVVAISLFTLFHDSCTKAVVRTRDHKELSKCNVLIDIGNGQYDHHQIGGNGSRKNGIPYASAGLIWKEFGPQIINLFAEKLNFPLYDDSQISTICKKIDASYIQGVDAIDNGITTTLNSFDYITSYLPAWNNASDESFNEAFGEALKVTRSILRKIIYKAIEEEYSLDWITKALRKNKQRIFEIHAQTFPWTKPVIIYNACHHKPIDFVIFSYSAGGWAAQCVPPSLNEPFKQRIPFPKEWAGQTNNLPEISGIPDATFCHNNCFFARANTKEAIIQMCEKAIEIFEKK